MKDLEWKWGVIIGAVSFVCSVAAWAVGLHGKGIGMIQLSTFFTLILAFAVYLVALRQVYRAEPEKSYLEGLRTGTVISIIAAVIAAGGQVIYFYFINPGWTEHLVEESRRHYVEAGLDADKVEEMLTIARSVYGMQTSSMQAGAAILLVGVLASISGCALFSRLAKR